jgi:2-furoyl-CoA dehydrogenase large subunit
VRKPRTRLSYRYVAAVGGKLAGFGQRMLDGIVRVLLATFFERLGRASARRAHAQRLPRLDEERSSMLRLFAFRR